MRIRNFVFLDIAQANSRLAHGIFDYRSYEMTLIVASQRRKALMAHDPILMGEADLRMAMLTNAVGALTRLIDDALMFTTLEGAVSGKPDDLEAHRSRRLRLTRVKPSDQHVLRCGAAAVVTVRMEVAGTWDEPPINGSLRYTRLRNDSAHRLYAMIARDDTLHHDKR